MRAYFPAPLPKTAHKYKQSIQDISFVSIISILYHPDVDFPIVFLPPIYKITEPALFYAAKQDFKKGHTAIRNSNPP